jgi:tRNA threonylcarbamoyl adenosine modification protein YeaZ
LGGFLVNILALNTASTSGSVAIARDAHLHYASYLDIRVTHSERLLPQIDSGLKQCNLTMGDIDLICVANGPGSFTGVRIGLATAKGFAMSNEIPLLAVSNLELLAWNVFGTSHAIMPVIDARMGEVYAALYSAGMQILTPGINSKPEAFFQTIDQPVVAVGDGAVLYRQAILDAGIQLIEPAPHQHLPMATTLLSIALHSPDIPTYDFEQISALEPFYLRKSQAEIVREANNSKRVTHE